MNRINRFTQLIQKNKGIFVPLLVFYIIISLFFFMLKLERDSSIASEQRLIADQLAIITSNIDSELNQRLRNIQGIVAYIQVNPDMTAAEFEAFVTKLIKTDDPVIKNISILKNTTITYVYPYEENKSAIGIDLAEIKGQKDDLLYVRDTGAILMTPPIKLVQGGQGIIFRIPIYIKDQIIPYWGQIGLVVEYNELLKQTGIAELKNHYNVIIDQYDFNGVYQHQMVNTKGAFGETTVTAVVDMPYASWVIKADYKEGYKVSPFFIFMSLLGMGFSLMVPAIIHNIYKTNDNLNILVDERTKRLYESNEDLEQSLNELHEQQSRMAILNNQLQESLDTLEETQQQLIMNEKLASLGELVASVAHEINTPLGICVTLTTYIQENELSLKNKLETESLTRSDLVSLNNDTIDALKVVNQNILRASDLVSSFKMVAVDQHLDDFRQVNLLEYITDVSKSLSPKIRKTPHSLSIDIPEDINVYTYPGALAQIVTNLIMNSLLHGLRSNSNGDMRFKVSTAENDALIIIEYTDNGIGIPKENLSKVFNPFFTTGKSSGSTGLGLHIIHNLIVQMLNGRITLESEEGKGVKFTVTLPYIKSLDNNAI